MLPTRTEKIKQFKAMILKDVKVKEDKGSIVKIGGGMVDFGCLGDCYVRTAKLVLYELMSRIDGKKGIDTIALTQEVKQLMVEVQRD